jgi:hypothetical protein
MHISAASLLSSRFYYIFNFYASEEMRFISLKDLDLCNLIGVLHGIVFYQEIHDKNVALIFLECSCILSCGISILICFGVLDLHQVS